MNYRRCPISDRREMREWLVKHPDRTSEQLAYGVNWSIGRVRRALRSLRETGDVERRAWWLGRLAYTWVYRLASQMDRKAT